MPKLHIELPGDLKRRLEEEATRDMRSQSKVMLLALEAYLDERERASADRAKMIASIFKHETPDDSK